MVEYAKINAKYGQIKFPLNSNIGDDHLRFERRFYNIQRLFNDAVGIVPAEFRQAILSIANGLHYGLVLIDCVDIAASNNMKIIRHTKSFDELETVYSNLIDVIFTKCPFEIKIGTKKFFLSLPFPSYHKDNQNE